MRKLVLVPLLLAAGCGGGSASGTVDPASEDFCLHWANAVCRLAYLCVDATSQDAAFRALYGTGTDTCWSGLEKRCTTNQTGSQAFGPSCGPGKKVNQTASQTCTDTLDTQSCVDWTAAPSGGCDSVCGAAATSDAGVATDTSSGSLATPSDFCSTDWNLTCDRLFECDAASSASTFGNLAGCKALTPSLCTGNPCPNGYSQANATACIAATKAASCQDLLNSATPTVCTSACIQ